MASAPQQTYFDMSMRIATLEEDVRHSRSQKAEAEIAVEFLARLTATKMSPTSRAPTADKEVLGLKKKLAQANNDRKRLRLKLNHAIMLLSAIWVARGGNSDFQPASKVDCGKPGNISDKECLIDLVNPSLSGEEHPILEDSDYGTEADTQKSNNKIKERKSSSSITSFSSDLQAAPYIFRFATDSTQYTECTDHFKASGEVAAGCFVNPKPTASASTETLSNRLPLKVADCTSQDSSNEPFSSPSYPGSYSTSFASCSSENSYDDIPSGGRHKAKGQRTQNLATNCARESENVVTDLPVNKRDFFCSKVERDNALRIHQREVGAMDLGFPDFFRYGVQYVPTEQNDDRFRTVLVSGLPPEARIVHVLEKIRGGIVLDAKLLDTLSITNSKTAIVTFYYETAAKAYVAFAKRNLIVINGTSVQVNLVASPTWPKTINIRKAVDVYGQTRCFEVRNIAQQIIPAIVREDVNLSPVMKIGGLETMKIVAKGVLLLRFSSIRYAIQASGIFSSFRRYRGCTIRWLQDPCAQALNTLLQPAVSDSRVPKALAIPNISNPESEQESLPQTIESAAKSDPENEATSHSGPGVRDEQPITNPTTSSFNTISNMASSICTLS
ncbi:MAG: hypothetical protein Q9163_004805 [Psora crenata]